MQTDDKALKLVTNEINNKRRKPKKKMRARVVGILVLVFAFLYIPSLFYWAYSVNMATDMIKVGTLEDSINLEGCIVRNEFVINASVSGKFFAEVNEGERVQAYATVASILSEANDNLLDRLFEVDKNLVNFFKNQSRKSGINIYEFGQIENDIALKMTELSNAKLRQNINKVNRLKNSIDSLLARRVKVVASLNINDATFNKLKNERNSTINKMKDDTKDISTPKAGVISYMIDGYEKELSPSIIQNLKPSDIQKISNNSMFVVPRDSRVEVGRAFAKIITDNEFYIVSIISNDQEKLFKQNDEVKVRIMETGRTIKGSITYKSQKIEGGYIIVLKVDRVLSETAGLRKVNLNILRNAYSGFKVPVSALSDINFQPGKARLMLIKAGVTRSVEVNIVGRDEEFAIIENTGISFSNGFSLYDAYVVNNNGIKEGQFIN